MCALALLYRVGREISDQLSQPVVFEREGSGRESCATVAARPVTAMLDPERASAKG